MDLNPSTSSGGLQSNQECNTGLTSLRSELLCYSWSMHMCGERVKNACVKWRLRRGNVESQSVSVLSELRRQKALGTGSPFNECYEYVCTWEEFTLNPVLFAVLAAIFIVPWPGWENDDGDGSPWLRAHSESGIILNTSIGSNFLNPPAVHWERGKEGCMLCMSLTTIL